MPINAKKANMLISSHYQRISPKDLDPPDWNASLWRYMDLPKFVAMLASNAVPLIRVDKFDDKWEGFAEPLSEDEYDGFFAEKRKESDLERYEHGEQLRKFYYASCWHLSDVESDAMWKLYVSADEGVAIRTTFQHLIYSLRKAPQEFLIGKVRYTNKPSAGQSMLLTCMTKRVPFIHENEVRVLWHDKEAQQIYSNKGADSVVNADEAKLFPCELKDLIEKVYLSPKAGKWFRPAVEDLLEKYKLKRDTLNPSELSEEPSWPKRMGLPVLSS